MPFSNNLGFGRIWKVFIGNYKVHSDNMGLHNCLLTSQGLLQMKEKKTYYTSEIQVS